MIKFKNMKDSISSSKIHRKSLKQGSSLHSICSLRKAPTSDYNNRIFRRSNTTKIDIEKVQYEAKLLLEEENDIENQFLF